jgi:hypothetical protein
LAKNHFFGGNIKEPKILQHFFKKRKPPSNEFFYNLPGIEKFPPSPRLRQGKTGKIILNAKKCPTGLPVGQSTAPASLPCKGRGSLLSLPLLPRIKDRTPFSDPHGKRLAWTQRANA